MQNDWTRIEPEMYHGVACDEQMTEPDWAREKQIPVPELLCNVSAMKLGYAWLEWARWHGWARAELSEEYPQCCFDAGDLQTMSSIYSKRYLLH